MNLDDRETDILPGQHISAKNIRYYGGQNGLTAQNVKGNYLVSNSNLPTGTNECIGAAYDQVKRRIIWFNYNSNGNNGIYQLTIQTGLVTQIFRCGVNSATDILNFSLDYPITSASIVYRTEGDGDLLYWTDGLNRPRYLNLDTVSALSPFTDAMLNAAKNAPLSPPTFPAAAGTNGVFGYFSDATVTFNSVKNKQFRFSYRWVYKNGEKSTFSPTSIVPLAWIIDPNIQYDETIYNYIKVVVYSPAEEDYQSIELFGQQWNGTSWGDFFIIDQLDRTQYVIPVSSSFTYSFYNNGSYVFVDPTESDLYFDWLPDKANALELLNGNVLIYGGITDGYDNLQRDEVDVEITTSLVSLTGLIGTVPNSCPTFKWGCQQRFGLVYFDSRGKTNGVISFVGDPVDTTDFVVTTPNYPGQNPLVTIQVPQISASINHLPPSWAVSYQWVRADLTPKFLQWVTNDYLVDNQYLYLGIEALVQMNARAGFLPSYEFTPGDRVRILAKFDGDNTSIPYTVQQDYTILEVVQKTMSSPASLGSFIKVAKPSSFPTPAYTLFMLVEIYTPKVSTPENQQLYYEWGQKYDIYTLGGIRYHMGETQNQTGSQPALFVWTEGDVYTKRRGFYVAVPIEANLLYSYLDMMDSSWNDYVAMAGNQNGRAWVINENAKQEYNQVLVRWGGKYQSGTNLNALNRFRPSDFDEVDRGKGDIRRFKVRDRILRVFQDRGVGQYGIYGRFIQNNEGVPELVTTNEIITTNNIQYYQGTFGLGGYPTNLCSTAISDYFADITTGREIRLSGDGLTDLGVLYKGQFTLAGYVTPYNKELLRTNGSIAKVMKFWDSFENEAHTVLQAGAANGTTTTDKNYSFNETRNGFCSFYDYFPEWALSADDIIYSWKDGQIYKHDTPAPYCNWYGTQYNAYVTVVFNPNIGMKKSWNSVAEVATDIWICPEITTSTKTYPGQSQQSNLIEQEFTLLEGMPSTSFKRDSNSPGGKWNGQYLKGDYAVVKFQKTNASNLISLSEIIVKFVESPLNVQ